jgi:tRNA wybutosine-synthesizing protein 2
VRLALERGGHLDPSRRIEADAREVFLPVRGAFVPAEAGPGARLVPRALAAAAIPEPPFERVRRLARVPEAVRPLLPAKWERIGDVVLLRLPADLEPFRAAVGEAYGRGLAARTVAAYGAIAGGAPAASPDREGAPGRSRRRGRRSP